MTNLDNEKLFPTLIIKFLNILNIPSIWENPKNFFKSFVYSEIGSGIIQSWRGIYFFYLFIHLPYSVFLVNCFSTLVQLIFNEMSREKKEWSSNWEKKKKDWSAVWCYIHMPRPSKSLASCRTITISKCDLLYAHYIYSYTWTRNKNTTIIYINSNFKELKIKIYFF